MSDQFHLSLTFQLDDCRCQRSVGKKPKIVLVNLTDNKDV